LFRWRLAPDDMELTRRRVVAGGAAAVGGVLVGNALYDDHWLCPEPAAAAWAVDDTVTAGSYAYGYWGPPVLDDDAVYVTEGHGIVAGGSGVVARVDRGTGGVRWTVEREPAGVGTPNPTGDVVYVPTGRNELLALAAAYGSVRWRVDAGVRPDDPGDSFALARPIVTDAGVVVQTFQGPTADAFDGDHAVAGVDAESGDLQWTRSLPARGRQVGVRDDVVVAAEDGSVRRLDTATGDVRWRETLDAVPRPIGSSPRTSVLPLLDADGTLIGLDAANGTTAWTASLLPADSEYEEPVDPVPHAAVEGDVVVAGTPEGAVLAHALESGTRRFRYDADAPVVAVDASDGVVVAMDARGFVHVLDAVDGFRDARLATAPRDEGETCGYRITDRNRFLRYLTVDDGVYVVARGMRRYPLRK
jgi:outer membrane protein assembly factor BamB